MVFRRSRYLLEAACPHSNALEPSAGRRLAREPGGRSSADAASSHALHARVKSSRGSALRKRDASETNAVNMLLLLSICARKALG